MTGYSLPQILDDLSLDQLMLVYRCGLEFEETKAVILLNKYAEAISGKKKAIGDKPDLRKFHALYGSKIKTKDSKKDVNVL